MSIIPGSVWRRSEDLKSLMSAGISDTGLDPGGGGEPPVDPEEELDVDAADDPAEPAVGGDAEVVTVVDVAFTGWTFTREASSGPTKSLRSSKESSVTGTLESWKHGNLYILENTKKDWECGRLKYFSCL